MEATQEQARTAEAPARPAAPPAAKKKSRAKPFIILGVLAALVAGGYGIYRWMTAGKETTDNAEVEADIIPVSTRIGGTVLEIKVHDNDTVKKNDIILVIDPADYDIRYDQASADLDAAKAQAKAAHAQVDIVLATSQGGLTTAQAQLSGSAVSVRSAAAQVDVARTQVTRAQTDVKKAKADLDRMISLKAANAATQVQVDDAQAGYDRANEALTQAQAQVAAAEEQRRVAQSHVAEAKGKVDQSAPIAAQQKQAEATAELADARVRAAAAALAQADQQRKYTTVLAPADGTISKLGMQPLQLVQPGQLIVELVPTDSYIIANFKETQVAHMKKGQRAEIKIDAFGSKTFEGTVESISAATGARFSLLPPDNASGNFIKVVQRVPVKIKWSKQPEVHLQAGLSADVTVFVE